MEQKYSCFKWRSLIRRGISGSCLLRNRIANSVLLKSVRQPVKPQINHWSCVEREQLAQNQSTDDGDAERPPQLRSSPWQQSERQTAEQRRHRRHHDRTEAQQAGLKYRFLGRLVLIP